MLSRLILGNLASIRPLSEWARPEGAKYAAEKESATEKGALAVWHFFIYVNGTVSIQPIYLFSICICISPYDSMPLVG